MKTLIACSFAILAVAFVLTSIPAANAQVAYKLGAKSQMSLAGTSTLHDWTMQATSFSTNAQVGLSADNHLEGISALTLTLPVINLKGSKDGLNENAWETLKYEDHKNIIFKLTSARVTPGGANKYQIIATGNLTIAGTTKPVSMNVNATANADGSLTCIGSLPIKLSHFNIERPSFMFGTMSVGDAMTLSYTINLVK
jgi:polyisoprenoid-binding protein YceI